MFTSFDDSLPGRDSHGMDNGDVYRSVDARGEFDDALPLDICKPGLEGGMTGPKSHMRSVDAESSFDFDDFAGPVKSQPNKFDSWSRPGLSATSKSLYPSLTPYNNTDADFDFGGFEEHLPSSTSKCTRLDKAPAYFSKCSSFISTSSHVDILRDLDDAFKKSDTVVHDFKLHKNKVKGISRVANESCHFVVKCWDYEGEVLVEVQNTGGCVVAFNAMYRTVLGYLEEHFVRRATTPKGTTDQITPDGADKVLSLDALPLPSLDDEDEVAMSKEDEDAAFGSLLDRLCEDATGNLVCAQRDALRTLTALTACPRNKMCLPGKTEGILKVLQSALRSPDEVVLEHACNLLVTLCSTCSWSRETVVGKMLANLFDVLESPGSLENRSCKRRVAEALVVLSSEPDHAKRLKANQQTLRKYATYKSDLCLQRSIATTLQRVEAV